MKKLHILIPSLAATASMPLVGLVGCSNDQSISISFNDCAWEEIANACQRFENGDLSEKEFCQTFHFEKSKPSKLNDFVGQTRNLYINGHQHQIIVIGVKQDTYNNNANTIQTTFTFQFNSLVSQETSGSFLTVNFSLDMNNKTSYWDTALEKALNSSSDVTWYNDPNEHQSVYTMILESDPSMLWTNSIKSVNRLVNDKSSGSWLPVERSVKLFVPTLSNFFSQEGLKSDISITKDDWQQYYAEGQKNISNKQYAYYAKKSELTNKQYTYIQNNPVNTTDKYSCLVHRDCSDYPSTNWYWISSPDLAAGTNNTIWSVSGAGGMYKSELSFHNAVAPCFCI